MNHYPDSHNMGYSTEKERFAESQEIRIKCLTTKCKELLDHNAELLEALRQCIGPLHTYVNGGNPNSPYRDGKHSCYVLGSREALDSANALLSKHSKPKE